VGISQNLRGGSGRLRPSIYVSVPPCGLGRPYVIVLAGREFIQTLEKLSRKADPRLWIQSEGFGLYFFYAYIPILHKSNPGASYLKVLQNPQYCQEAIRCFRPAAEQGDANAQYNLGVMYAMRTARP